MRGTSGAQMAANLERFRNDLDRLLDKGSDLQLAFIIGACGEKEGRKKLIESQIDQDKIHKALSQSKSFTVDYQAWYSECLAVIKQIIPDRLTDFRALYEKPNNRKNIDFLTYVISDAMIGLQTTKGGQKIADSSAAIPKFQAQLAILASARTRFSSSLFEIRQLVQADLFDSEIDSARYLLKNKFLRAAGAIAGVILEKHLRQVCEDHGINITKKHPTINDLNELLKSSSVIDVPTWRRITLLGDIGNLCDHNKQNEPTEEQVSE